VLKAFTDLHQRTTPPRQRYFAATGRIVTSTRLRAPPTPLILPAAHYARRIFEDAAGTEAYFHSRQFNECQPSDACCIFDAFHNKHALQCPR